MRFACEVLALSTLGVGCSSPLVESSACDAKTMQPIVNGGSRENYLGLSQGQTRAIVEIVEDPDVDGPSCSGAFVRDDWVVTAAHCGEVEPAVVAVRWGDGQRSVAPVLARVASTTADVALLEVDPKLFGAAAPEPIELLDDGGPALASGTLVEVAGYGRTETGEAHELRFLVEPIHELDAASIVVTGAGASGACEGDSGGPLLVRGMDGSVRIAGTLAAGSPYCTETDRYVRTETVVTWVGEVTGTELETSSDCGGIDAVGRCLYGSAMWCAPTGLHAERCDSGSSCGWDAEQGGFRCVAAGLDPCAGVDSFGACRGGGVVRCSDGVLERERCSCGDACRIEGSTGRPLCVTAGE